MIGVRGESQSGMERLQNSSRSALAALACSVFLISGCAAIGQNLFDEEDAPSYITQVTPNGYLYAHNYPCLLYTSPSPRDKRQSRMPSSA